MPEAIPPRAMGPAADLDVELKAIALGDAEAFGRWMSGAEHALRAALCPFAEWVDVEAVLQETLLRVWQVSPRFRPDGRPNGLLRLAFTIARNLATSELRRNRPTAAQLDELERALASSSEQRFAPPDPLLKKVIEECRRRLPRKPALALAQRLDSAGGEPDDVLAGRLGMRLNTFLQNFTRARKLLADCLRSRGVELVEP